MTCITTSVYRNMLWGNHTGVLSSKTGFLSKSTDTDDMGDFRQVIASSSWPLFPQERKGEDI